MRNQSVLADDAPPDRPPLDRRSVIWLEFGPIENL
jgi:hypothetical protein